MSAADDPLPELPAASEGRSSAPDAPDALANLGIDVVAGDIGTEEFVALTTVLASMAAVSREEAEKRAAAERNRTDGTLWQSPVRTVQRSQAVRRTPGPGAWLFSERD